MSVSTEIVLSGHLGIYLPQKFAESANHELLTGYDSEDIDVLLKGPEHEHYWDVWSDVLDNAEYVDEKEYVWHLYQDEDLWAFCKELMSESELDDFMGM